ncbi:MAG: hypothetical protein FJ255_05250 [Phycisphaerae bacterium]|nr:hypothetical protein [Phycisphaerae bacterium]
MREIRRVVAGARNRLTLMQWVRALVALTTAALAGLVVGVVVQRGLGLTFPWPDVFLWSGAGVLAASMAWALIRRPGVFASARALDEAADLRESMSTALVLEKSPDPWAGAVIETARARAAGVLLRRCMPVRGPAWWYSPVVGGVTLVIAWVAMPNLDLLGYLAERQAREDRNRQVVEVKADLHVKEQKLAEALARAGLDLKAEAGDGPGQVDPSLKPDEIQRAAVRRLSNLNERLNELKQGEKSQQFEALKEAMQQLRQPGPGPLQEMARHLAMGDFAKAEQSLAELARQVQSGEMAPEQREQLARQLENLSAQLKEAAEKSQALEQALAKSGVDPEKAAELAKKMLSDPAAAKEMLDKVKQLSPEQQKKLAEMARSLCEAGGQCDKLGQALSDMARAMAQQGGLGQQGAEAMAEAGQALSDMEMLSQEMNGLSAALEETQAQLESLCEGGSGQCDGDMMMAGAAGIGEWEEGESDRQGTGSGGPGKGMGPSTADSPASFKIDKTKQNVGNKGGPIIASRLVFGEQVKGESVAEFASAVESGTHSAAEALESNVIPRELHNAVKHYFGRLESRVKARPEPAPK